MDLFGGDDGGNRKRSKDLSFSDGYALDDIVAKLDLDLKRWITFSGLSLDTTQIYTMSTICCMIKSEREIAKNPDKYRKEDLEFVDESNIVIMEAMLNKKKTSFS